VCSALGPFAEYAYFRDEFAGVEHRNELMAGVSYKVVDRALHALSVDGGLGYVNERRTAGSDVSSGTFAFGGRYRWQLSPSAELSEDARLTGTFAEATDWRGDDVVSIAARPTSLFSLKVSNTIRYVNAPVPGFQTTDTNTAIALVAKF
jgi:putative salt-induced outer membrane protein YdiY